MKRVTTVIATLALLIGGTACTTSKPVKPRPTVTVMNKKCT